MTPTTILIEKLSLKTRLERLLSEGLDAESAASEAVRRLKASELREAVLPLVEHFAKQLAREATRALESDLAVEPFDALAARQTLVGERFWVRTKGYVPWLEATAEDHLERAAAQRLLAGRCVVDAERHEAAAAAIQDAGVSCLAEISA